MRSASTLSEVLKEEVVTAIYHYDLEKLKILSEKIDFSQFTHHGRNALAWAVEYISPSSDLPTSEYNTFYQKIKSTIDFFLEQGIDINEYSDYGYNPLSKAVGDGNIEIILYLLFKGADIDAVPPEDIAGSGVFVNVVSCCELYGIEIASKVLKIFIDNKANPDLTYHFLGDEREPVSFNSRLAKNLAFCAERSYLAKQSNDLSWLKFQADQYYKIKTNIGIFSSSAKRFVLQEDVKEDVCLDENSAFESDHHEIKEKRQQP